MNICCIELTKNAQKDLAKMPGFIKDKLFLWIDAVERLGIHQVRKIPGFHDEPLKGNRKSQRSIRLNKAAGQYTWKVSERKCILFQ